MTDWTDALRAELGLAAEHPLDVDALLVLARDAAHGVERTAAPLTTYLVGLAAGLAGGTAEAAADATARAAALARSWESRG
jgi:hypothetical protein